MTSHIHSFNINKPFMLGSLFVALIIHSSIIPISSLIKTKTNESIEPKLVLELLNNMETPDPIKSLEKLDLNTNIKNHDLNIEKPIPIQKIEKIDKPNDIIKNINDIPIISKKPEMIENQITNEIIKPNQPNLTINIKPQENIIKLKPSEKLSKPINNNYIRESLIENRNLQDISNEIDINLNSISNQQINKVNKAIKPLISNVNEKNINELSTEELNALEKYKNTIRSTIQAYAMANYPKKLQRRKIQGIVQLIFKLNNDGSILSVIDGPNTDAPEELIDAALKALINSGPFESNELLKENNEFSIDIIYKIQ